MTVRRRTVDQVLVVGAGPTGLTLACELAWRGVPVRVIDARARPSTRSKAIGVFARTLELLDRQGLAGPMIERGLRLEAGRIFGAGRQLAQLQLSRIESRYNFMLSLEQSQTEAVLLERLSQLGVEVERPVRLVGLEQDDGGVQVRLEHAGEKVEALEVPWVVGCDGARSATRQALALPFEGERYEPAFAMADVVMRWEGLRTDSLAAYLSSRGPMLQVPLANGQVRLVVPRVEELDDEELTLDHFRGWWRERTEGVAGADEVELVEASWISGFRIARRRVSKLRQGRVMLAGDAAHVHSPAGAQGMNLGIGDAINLGWKLAMSARGQATASLLDSYAVERLPLIDEVLRITDLGTKMALSERRGVQWLRNHLISLVANRHAVQDRALPILSQLHIDYGHSPIVGPGGGLRAVPLPEHPTHHPEHTLLSATAPPPRALPPWVKSVQRPGLDGWTLVRPDLYVAMAGAGDVGQAVERYQAMLTARTSRSEAAVDP